MPKVMQQNGFFLGNYGDKRIDSNMAKLYQSVHDKQEISLKKLGEDRAKEVAFGRALSNEKVEHSIMSKALAAQTNKNCINVPHILVPQDTVETTYPTQPIKKESFGYTTHKETKGIFTQGAVAINASNSEVLGVAAIMSWSRGDYDEASNNNKDSAIEEKESSKWQACAESAKEQLSNPDMITFIGDRESDIVEYFMKVIDERTHIISRARSDRMLATEEKISERLVRLVESYKKIILLPVTRERKKEREAEFEIKFCQVQILAKDGETVIKMYCVQALEIGEVPAGEERVSWVLLTSHPVRTLKKALRILKWYSWRWIVEEIHRVMKKQGIAIESSQLETVRSLLNLSVICYATAVKIMLLVKARDGSEQDARHYFRKSELRLLEILNIKLSGKTEKQQNPHKKNTIGWVAWVIARLGSWHCYGKKPGPITMSNGYREFQSLYKGYSLTLQKDIS